MAKLSVNVDHVATLREARKINEPNPVAAAVVVELAGADGITIHLREDRRHIKDSDLMLLREIVETRLNLEMANTKEMVEIALRTKPDQITLVPEKREEVTTEGGLDIIKNQEDIVKTINQCRNKGIRVSLFIDPDEKQIGMAKRILTDAIEINTGKYSIAYMTKDEDIELKKIQNAVALAAELNLGINAGHGLTSKNITKIVRQNKIDEFNIGHSIISRSLFIGLDRAVKEMIKTIKDAERR